MRIGKCRVEPGNEARENEHDVMGRFLLIIYYIPICRYAAMHD